MIPRSRPVSLAIIILCLYAAHASAADSLQSRHGVTPTLLGGRLVTLSSAERLRTARVVANALPLTATLLERQRQEGFNTVLLNDVTGWSAATHQWSRLDDAHIAAQLALARAYDFSVFVCIAAILPQPPDERRRSAATNSFVPFGIGSSSITAASHGMHSASVDRPEGWTLIDNMTLQSRIRRWTSASRGELIGVFFSPDDSFLLRIPASTQRQWRTIARDVDPMLPVLGIAGELGLSGAPSEMQQFWAPTSFDALIWINYPYNLSRTWKRPLDHISSSDPDGDLIRYEQDYVEAMHSRFFLDLSTTQWIIPVIQTFHYRGDPAGTMPRVRDIELQARVMRDSINQTLGQPRNLMLGYFYTGSAEASADAVGIYDIPEWLAAVALENRRLEKSGRDERDREARLIPVEH